MKTKYISGIVIACLIVGLGSYSLGFMRGFEYVMKQQASYAMSQSRLYAHAYKLIECDKSQAAGELLQQFSHVSETHANESLNDAERISWAWVMNDPKFFFIPNMTIDLNSISFQDPVECKPEELEDGNRN